MFLKMNKSHIDTDAIDNTSEKRKIYSKNNFEHKKLEENSEAFNFLKPEIKKKDNEQNNIFTFKKKNDPISEIQMNKKKETNENLFQQKSKVKNNSIFNPQKGEDLIDFEKDMLLENEINREIQEEKEKGKHLISYAKDFSDSDNDEYESVQDKNAKENLKFSNANKKNEALISNDEINKKKNSTIKFLQDNSSEDDSSNEIVNDEPFKQVNDNDIRAKSYDPFKISDVSPIRSEKVENSKPSNITNQSSNILKSSRTNKMDISMGQGINIDDISKVESVRSYKREESNKSLNSNYSSSKNEAYNKEIQMQQEKILKFSKNQRNEENSNIVKQSLSSYEPKNNYNNSQKNKDNDLFAPSFSLKQKEAKPNFNNKFQNPQVLKLKQEMKDIVKNIDEDEDFKSLQLLEIIKKNNEIKKRENGDSYSERDKAKYETPSDLWRDTLAIKADTEKVFVEERNAFMNNFENFLTNLDIDNDPTILQEQVDSYIEQCKAYNLVRNGKLK